MSQQILTPGIDPTSYASITGAQLAQLVAGAQFAMSVGGNILSVDDSNGNPTIPDADVDTTLKTFIWLRIGNPATTGNVVTPYVWNPNQASGTLLRWQQVQQSSIGASSILGYMLAPASVDKTKINGLLDASQIAGLSPLSQFLNNNSIPASGALSGSYALGFQLAINAINNINQFTTGIINSNLPFSGQSIKAENLVTTGTTAGQIVMAINGAGYNAAFVTKAIVDLAEPDGTTQNGYLPVVQSDGTLAWTNPAVAVPAGQVTAAATINVNPIVISAISINSGAKTYTITPSSMTGITVNTPVGFNGGVNQYTALNGSWTPSNITGTTFDVVVTGTPSNSTNNSAYYPGLNYVASLTAHLYNVASIDSIAGVDFAKLKVNFTSAYADTDYAVLTSLLDSSTVADFKCKITSKSLGYVSLAGYRSASSSYGTGFPNNGTSIVASQIHLLVG